MSDLPEGWVWTRVDELCRVTRGASPRPIHEWIADSGTPWIKIADATADPYKYITKTKEFIRNEGRNKSVVVYPGDLILSNSATPGIPKFLGIEACIHDGWLLLRDLHGIDPMYFYYVFLNDRKELAGQGNGSIFTNLKTDIVKSHKLRVPGISEQQAIAEVLGALDDKIAANTKLAATTAHLSRAMFDRMRADTRLSMPLSATAQFVNGKAFTKNASGTGRIVVRIAELNSGIGGSTVYNDIGVDDQYLARPGDILFAWSGSLTLHRWYRSEAIVNQHIFKVIPYSEYPKWLVYELIQNKLDAFKLIAADKATTMGHIQRRHLDEPVFIPERDAVAKNDSLMGALWDRTLTAEIENLKLAATRDALLPQLMSGKLRVKDAETIVANAT